MNLLGLYLLSTLVLAAPSPTPLAGMPKLHTSSDLTNYVQKSLQQDLETLNLLDRAMATPKSKRINRKLKRNQNAETIPVDWSQSLGHSPKVRKASKTFVPKNRHLMSNPFWLSDDDKGFSSESMGIIQSAAGGGSEG